MRNFGGGERKQLRQAIRGPAQALSGREKLLPVVKTEFDHMIKQPEKFHLLDKENILGHGKLKNRDEPTSPQPSLA